jgi:hypothetical protein
VPFRWRIPPFDNRLYPRRAEGERTAVLKQNEGSPSQSIDSAASRQSDGTDEKSNLFLSCFISGTGMGAVLIVHHSLPSAAHRITSSSTENTHCGLDSKATIERECIHFRRDHLVAAAIQESAHIKFRETRDAELPILLHVDEFVKQ